MTFSEVLQALVEAHLGSKAACYAQTVSTNSDAKRLAAGGAAEGTAVIAANQTGGRGRLTRSFFCYEGGLYMSIILRPDMAADEARLITAAAAVAVCNALEELGSRECQIKWVNDVYIGGKKVCGILTEGGINPKSGRLDYAVLGIGVNLCSPKGGFPDEICGIADCAFSRVANAELLVQAADKIYREFFKIYKRLQERAFLEHYRRRSFLKGKTVSFERGGGLLCGRVLGIDDNAGLVLEVDGRPLTLGAGEVSVKWQ